MGSCFAGLALAMAACGATAWSGWSAGNTGNKYWSTSIHWTFTGLWPYQYALATRGDAAINDVEFRYNVPNTPAGMTLKESYYVETQVYAGSSRDRLVHAATTPGSYFLAQVQYTPGSAIDSTGWVDPWWPMPTPTSCYVHNAYSGSTGTLTVGDLVLIYEYDDQDDDDPACDPINAQSISDSGATLSSPDPSAFQWGTRPADASYVACTMQNAGDTVTKSSHGLSNGQAVMFKGASLATPVLPDKLYYVVNKTTSTFQLSAVVGGAVIPLTSDGSGSYAVTTINSSADGVLTGLATDTWYFFVQGGICPKTFWFKTTKVNDWSAYIVTLAATEVWATGATIHGLLDYQGDSDPYLYLGFQWGLASDVSGEEIHWFYSGTYHTGKYPLQATIAGLYPDRTYYFRACLHVGAPPFTSDNYFGATLSFGGPDSIFGEGREYLTAKKGADDVSKFSAGRYYMTRDGVLQYESKERREA